MKILRTLHCFLIVGYLVNTPSYPMQTISRIALSCKNAVLKGLNIIKRRPKIAACIAMGAAASAVGVYLFKKRSHIDSHHNDADGRQLHRLPIVYHDDYNIRLLGLEKLHPFDTTKYGKIYQFLRRGFGLQPNQFHRPQDMVTDAELRLVHTQEYLDSLRRSATIARISEVWPLRFLPNFLLQRFLLNGMRYAVRGTVDAANLAMEHGWSINLAGGYHHAQGGQASGFCFYADTPLAIASLQQRNPNLRVLIVDLDAHHGDGNAVLCATNPNVAILDMYSWPNFPYREHPVRYGYPLKRGTGDEEYMHQLTEALPRALEEFAPDLVIYNAGSDPYVGDRIGRLGLTAEGIANRDRFVFHEARSRHVPIMMVLSGGYCHESHQIVSNSIAQILQDEIGIERVQGAADQKALVH